MIRARFLEEQPAVHSVKEKRGIRIFLCLNGEKKVEKFADQDGNMVDTEFWEYDYNEFVTSEEIKEKVIKNPAAYLDYAEKVETAEEKVKTLEETVSMLTDCVLEMSAMVYE